MADFEYFRVLSVFSLKKMTLTQKSILCSDSQIDKPQRGRPERAKLSDININTGTQIINTERASLKL